MDLFTKDISTRFRYLL